MYFIDSVINKNNKIFVRDVHVCTELDITLFNLLENITKSSLSKKKKFNYNKSNQQYKSKQHIME